MKAYERAVNSVAGKFGLQVSRASSAGNQLPIEITESEISIIEAVRPFTMTRGQKLWSLIDGVRYVTQAGIPGDFVECGVWRGGSVMAMTLELKASGIDDRNIWLYDTFEGMTAPTGEDIEAGTGISAAAMLETTPVADGNNVWCVAGIDDVRANVLSTGYPSDRFNFVKGDVSQTLHESVPDTIALLRLDTDWYESTKSGLEILYPRLAIGGVCILDDYGHWQGARQAVDEYFASQSHRPYMHPIDYSGRVFTKTG
jgi:O-methyltransferase